MKEFLKKLCLSFFIITILFISNTYISFSEVNYNSSKETVNVGIFDFNKFQYRDENGEYKGYNIDLLNEIKKYTNWEYNYIYYKDKDSAMRAVNEGRIDFLAPFVLSPDIIENYDFTDFSAAKDYIAIVTKNTNNIGYEDFNGMDGNIFGLIRDTEYVNSFFRYCDAHEIHPTVRYYNSQSRLKEALENDEINCAVTSVVNSENDYRIIGKIRPVFLHYICDKDSDFSLKLDGALNAILVNTPEYLPDLQDKYFGNIDKQRISSQERDFISIQNIINVGYYDKLFPFSYKQNKVVDGIIKDICIFMSKSTDLMFDYVKIDFHDNLAQKMIENDINILGPIDVNLPENRQDGLLYTVPVLESYKYLYTLKNFSLEDNLVVKNIAVSKNNKGIIKKAKEYFPNFNFVIYENTEQCFKAVYSRHCDGLIENQYVAQRFTVKPQFSKFFIRKEVSIPEKYCFVLLDKIEGHYDKNHLLSIINKSLINLGKDHIVTLAVNKTLNNISYSVFDFFIKYKMEIIFICIILVVIIYRLYERKKFIQNTIKAVSDSEKKLRNIFNNIDGGLAVLLPDKDFEFSYVNDGFQNIIDTSERMLKPSFLDYIHPKDRDAFIEFVQKKTNESSFTLRLQKSNGIYVYCMVKISEFQYKNEKNEIYNELYVAIFDITEKMRIDQELRLEKKRFELVMEKANEVIFEVGIDGLHITDRFKKNYGWQLRQHSINDKPEYIASCWKTTDEDKQKIINLVDQSVKLKKTSSDVIRLKCGENSYIWTKLSMYPIVDLNGELVSILGKVQDATGEIKEKEELLKLSQTEQMTGLLTKTSFKSSVTKLLKNDSAKRCAFIFLDLDNFKNINDTFGHKMGDNAILDATKNINDIFSEIDLITRFGGDEFCIFARNISRETLENKVEMLRKNMEKLYTDGEKQVNVTASIGVCYCNKESATYEKFFIIADKATYISKNSGKNQYNFIEYTDDVEID